MDLPSPRPISGNVRIPRPDNRPILQDANRAAVPAGKSQLQNRSYLLTNVRAESRVPSADALLPAQNVQRYR